MRACVLAVAAALLLGACLQRANALTRRMMALPMSAS